jgi:glutamyl-tRNA reductase
VPLVLIGISHRTASVALRERLALTSEAERRWFAEGEARVRLATAGLTEFSFLSTCNRSELYAACGDPHRSFPNPPPEALELLAEMGGLSLRRLKAHLYARTGRPVLHHLCRVAAGLDSMVLGEMEILGQVGEARDLASRHGTIGPVLEECFRTALRSGRRARVETGICRGSASMSTEAVRLLGEPLGEQHVLVVGTGKMGRLTGAALRARGVKRISVVSRTTRNARALAKEWDATALRWSDLPSAIRSADAVLCSTRAPHAVITRDLVRQALGPRGDGRRRVMVDLAVPRDVEPSVGSFPGIELHDIDSFQHQLDLTLAARRREVPAVEGIIAEELGRFEGWLQGTALRPLLAQIRARGEAIRQRELERLFGRAGDLPPELKAQLEAFSASLVNALLDGPTRRLRGARDPGEAGLLTAATRHLFGLDGQNGDRSVPDGSAA